MAKNILHIIEKNMHGFSKGQKRIGAYILEKPDGVAKPMVKQNQDAGLEQTSADGEYAAEAEKQISVTELTVADGMPTE